jgi:membrane-bound lytic murein transglycosylase D
MKYLLFHILLLWIPFTGVAAERNYAGTYCRWQAQDTLPEQVDREDSLINDILTSKKAPEKDKVQYISQQTRYGFKNLFTSFGYNASLPYSMQVNPKAEFYMQDYLQAHGKSLQNMKTWGVPYFNLIDHILTQYGLPRELKYLAVIESNLKTSATSWVGAAGPWQFMPATARRFGLQVNRLADDRRDYMKSTHAAAQYLLELYRQLHDWLLVIAAYNGGPGRVYDAIRRSGSRNFWNLQYYLPQESRNHVKKFIATHYVMEAMPGNSTGFGNAGAFYSNKGGGNIDNNPKLSEEELARSEKQTISGKYVGEIVARHLSMETALFNRYNPDFDNRLSANGQYDLVLPSEKMELFLVNKYQILNECVNSLLSAESVPNTRTVYPSSPAGKQKRKIH